MDGGSLYDPLLGGVSIVERILPTRSENLFLVPADLDLAGAEVEVARMKDHLTRLTGILDGAFATIKRSIWSCSIVHLRLEFL